MRKAQPQSVQKIPTPSPDVLSKVVPVPTDGWDAISPLASMDPKRAPILNNWIPRPGWAELREGYFPWIFLNGITAPVETLMVRRATGGEQMFAAAGSVIYDASVTGATTSVVTGLNSARWQYVNFTPALGTTVIQLVNGVDTLRQYNGTAWSVPAITGLPNSLTTAAITNIHAQKRRLWYVLGDGIGHGSTVAAFMPTDAITGAIAGTIDLGANWTKGGFLVAITDWTVDGGNGPQDYMVFISSRGQVSIFSGTDPTNASTFSLVGTFDMSPPISNRCATKIGSDVAIITQQGVIPLSQALPFDPSAERSVSITARIQNAMAQAAAQSMNLFGWQLISFAPQQLGILNIPQTENEIQVQYVMNALTGAWCQFTGWNANCFEVFNNTLYFGGNKGDINQCFVGSSDFGNPILADMQCAYNYFDAPGRLKRMTMVQPFITAGQTITPFISVDADFQTQTQTAGIQILSGGATWDLAVWDSAMWFGDLVQTTSWLSADAIGHALAVHLTLNIATTTTGINGTPALFDFSYFDQAEFDVGVSTTSTILQVNAFNTLLEMGGFI
jgi:hypothetical protein